MAKKYTAEDFYDIGSFDLFNKMLDKLKTNLTGVIELSSKKIQSSGGDYEGLKKQVEAMEAAKKAADQLNEVNKEQVRIAGLKKKALEAEEGSYNQLKAVYDANQIVIRGAGTETRKNSEEIKKLIIENAKLYKQMSDLKNETGKWGNNLGLFKDVVDVAAMSMGDLRKELVQLKNITFVGKSQEEIDHLNERIGELAHRMKIMRAESQILGTEGAAVFVSGLKTIAAGVEGVVGTLSLFGVESEQIEKVEKNLTALIAVTQSLSEIEEVISSGKARAMLMRIQDMALSAKDTVVKWLNVAATTAQIRAESAKEVVMGKGNLVTKAAAAVQWAWNAAMAANPIGLIIAGVAALASGIYLLIRAMNSQTQAEKDRKIQMEAYAEAKEKANESASKELASMTILINEIGKETTSRKKRKEMVEELDKQFPGYLSKMEREKLLAGDTADAYDKLSKAIYQKALVNALEEELTKAIKEQLTAMQKMNGERIAAHLIAERLGNTVNYLVGQEDNYKKAIEEAAGAKNKTAQILKLITAETDKLNKITADGTVISEKQTKDLKEKWRVYGYLKDELEANIKYEEELAKRRQDRAGKDLENVIKSEEDKKLYIDEIRANQLMDDWQFAKTEEEILKEKFDKGLIGQLRYDYELNKLKDKQRKKEEEQRAKEIAALEDFIKTVEEKRQRAMDREIDNSKRHQDMLRQMAAQGSEDAKDNLAFEEANQRKLELKKEKELQRAKQIELGLAVLKSYSKNIETSGGDTGKALSQTMKDALILTAFIKALPSFYEGTENTGSGGKLDDKGGFQAILHPNERVMTAEQNKQLNGISNWELVNAGTLYKKGIDKVQDNSWLLNETIIKKFDELKEEIKNKPSLTGTEYDGVTNSIISIIEKGNSIQRNHKRLSKLG